MQKLSFYQKLTASLGLQRWFKVLSLMCGSLFHFSDNPNIHNCLFPTNLCTNAYPHRKHKKQT